MKKKEETWRKIANWARPIQRRGVCGAGKPPTWSAYRICLHGSHVVFLLHSVMDNFALHSSPYLKPYIWVPNKSGCHGRAPESNWKCSLDRLSVTGNKLKLYTVARMPVTRTTILFTRLSSSWQWITGDSTIDVIP
jgi:hypothetical protein